MAAMSISQLAEFVGRCQARAKDAEKTLLKTFSFVPDDKLKWSPASTARTSLAIVAHCGMANEFFAGLVAGKAMPYMPTPAELKAMELKFEASITDRADALRRLQASTQAFTEALATVTPERCATSPDSPFGSAPMPFWMELAGAHVEYHTAQINYLQTIWGDVVDHM